MEDVSMSAAVPPALAKRPRLISVASLCGHQPMPEVALNRAQDSRTEVVGVFELQRSTSAVQELCICQDIDPAQVARVGAQSFVYLPCVDLGLEQGVPDHDRRERSPGLHTERFGYLAGLRSGMSASIPSVSRRRASSPTYFPPKIHHDPDKALRMCSSEL